MSLCDKLKEILHNFDRWLWPKEIEKPECVLQLLKTLYPTVNWNNVHFYNSLPWFIPSSQASAITLPGTYNFTRINIYFDNNFDPCSCGGLATIVHEGLHVLQYTDIGLGGLGFIRLFMIQYFGCLAANGFHYDDNPMEIEAYAEERRFMECCRNKLNPLKICDCSKKPPAFNQDALNQLIANCPALVKPKSEFSYNCGFFSLIFGAWLIIYIAVLIPIVEVTLFIILILLLYLTALVCALTWLWDLICNILSAICTWTIEWEKKCKKWARQTIQHCREYRDNGYNACSQYQDQGYQSCSQWADQGYNSCCTWWPCSWGCKAFVWIANLVCKGWFWVTHLVCVAWYWFSSWVCIAWATIVKWVYTLFAWIIKIITCW